MTDKPQPRLAYVGTEVIGPPRPACGPLLSDCRQHHVACGSGPGGFNVYKCDRCGDEEWL